MRGCRHQGLSYKRMISKLTDGSSYLSFLLPLQLNDVAKAMAMPPRYLLHHHTMYPYVTAFMSAEKAAAVEEKILLRPADASLASLTASVTQAVPFRRACKECIRQDIQQHGESFWRRSHHLPGVHLCAHHGTELWETNIPLRSGVANFNTPAESNLQRYRADVSNDILKTVTDLSNRALKTRIQHVHLRHRALACLKGYLLERGCIPTRELTRELHRFLGDAYLDELRVNLHPESRAPWPSLLVRPGAAIEATPAKHILLETFLCRGPSFTGQTDYSPPGRKADYVGDERKAIANVNRQLKQLAESGSRITVPALLTHAGIWHKFRNNRSRYPELRALVETFRASPQSERQVGHRPRKY